MALLLWQVLLYWRFPQHKMQKIFIITLRALQELSEEIFSCLLQTDYPQQIYLYERRLHLQKNKVIAAFAQLSRVLLCRSNQPEAKQQLAQIILLQCNKLYDLLLDCAQLRWRLTDYTALGLCSVEISGVLNALIVLFSSLKKSCLSAEQVVDINILEQKINQLEENYQQVLQVTTPEPLVFLLFIFSLKDFSREANALIDLLREAWEINLI